MTYTKEIELLFTVMPKILSATICGAIIGWDREKKQKVAGLRTIVLITVGSCIFTLGAFLIEDTYTSDPSRIISTIVTGIGFLGGGVIIQHQDKVVGVTTAAFIWVVAGIGILCGLGLIIMPVILTIGLLAVSAILGAIEIKMATKSNPNQ